MRRQVLAGVRMLLVMTVVLGLAYPLLVTGIAQLTMPNRANGSLVSVDGSSHAPARTTRRRAAHPTSGRRTPI